MRRFVSIFSGLLLLGLVLGPAEGAPAPERFDENTGNSGTERVGRSASPSAGSSVTTDDLQMNIGAVLDSVQTLHTDPTSEERNEFELRSFEINFGGAVDPHFDAFATIGFHDGQTELEEGYVLANLPGWTGAKLKFGKEKLNLGYLNRLHPHDFPQIDAPVAFEKMLGTKGIALEGAHLQWLRPVRENMTLGLETGLYNGFGEGHGDEEEGHGHGGLGEQFAEGQRPYHLRGTVFYESEDLTHGLLVGFSYLNVLGNEIKNDGSADTELSKGLTVADVKYRYRPPATTSQLVLAGEWYRHQGVPEDEFATGSTRTENFSGYFLYGQYDLDRYWGIGTRYGESEHLNNSNTVQNTVLYAEYRPSEFSRFRFQARQNTHPEQINETILGIQGTMFLGWHPAHRF
jgi:hypothetical protein